MQTSPSPERFDVCMVSNHSSSAFFNNITYVRPKVPTLYSVISSGPLATNAEIYGTNTNAFILKKDEIVEIILNNDDKGRHPFHLHGHTFQTVARSEEEGGFYNGSVTLPKVPMRRDTIMVNPNGNIVLRFKADNPDKYTTDVRCYSSADVLLHASGYSTVTSNGTWLPVSSPL